MTDLQCYYGEYVHPVCEVEPEKIVEKPLYNDSGEKWATEVLFTVKGDLVGANGSLTREQVATRIAEIDAAYSVDGKNFGFTNTPHVLDSSDAANLSGNVVVYRSWDHVYPTELLNTRSFRITVRALLLKSSGVHTFREQVTRVGTGGQSFVLYNTANGPQRVNLVGLTKVRHYQRGTIIGVNQRLSPPPPLWPLEEEEENRQIVTRTPRYFGDPTSRQATLYRTDYSYSFKRLGPDAVTPPLYYVPGA